MKVFTRVGVHTRAALLTGEQCYTNDRLVRPKELDGHDPCHGNDAICQPEEKPARVAPHLRHIRAASIRCAVQL